MKLPFKDDNVIENYGNNGIYGRFSNSAEAFGFLATLHSPFATLRSGHITSGYGATGVALPSPKFASQTSHIRRTLCEMLNLKNTICNIPKL